MSKPEQTRHEKIGADNTVHDSTLYQEPCRKVSARPEPNSSNVLQWAVAILLASWLAYYTTESAICQVFAAKLELSATLTLDNMKIQAIMTKAYLQPRARTLHRNEAMSKPEQTRHEKIGADNTVHDSTLYQEPVTLRNILNLEFKYEVMKKAAGSFLRLTPTLLYGYTQRL